MRAEVRSELEKLHTMQPQEADQYIARILEENFEMRARLDETANASGEMALQFKQMKDELEGARREIAELRKQNQHLTGVHTLAKDELYGRSTEKTEDLINGKAAGTEPEDPVREDQDPGKGTDPKGNPDPNGKKNPPRTPGSGSGDGKKGRNRDKGKRERDLSGLPVCTIFDYDIGELDAKYGEGNWRFAYWHGVRSVEIIRKLSYVQVVFTPVISVGYEQDLVSIPYANALFPKSIASPALVAELMYEKHDLFLPAYRMEHDENHFGFPLSRQTMVNWIIRGALELLKPVYEFLRGLERCFRYQQCDETPYMVIRDGRNPGAKSYIWTHRTSELADGPAMIVYCYEKTREAKHLLLYYEGLEETIYITSDAYTAYYTLEEAMHGLVISCGCFMHARRKFADAFKLLNAADMDAGALKELPEAKALLLIQKIYLADEALKGCSAEERQSRRNTEVRPLVDAYFTWIHSLDQEDPLYSEKLREAIRYSVNEEARLRRFLEDGNIPIDDGATERNIKPIALGRRNYLFSTSIKGAEATAIISSLIATAKANGADPYYYLKYLLEQMSRRVYYSTEDYSDSLPDMMPWSDAYKAYECSEKQRIVNTYAPPGMEKPKTPRKSRKNQVA